MKQWFPKEVNFLTDYILTSSCFSDSVEWQISFIQEALEVERFWIVSRSHAASYKTWTHPSCVNTTLVLAKKYMLIQYFFFFFSDLEFFKQLCTLVSSWCCWKPRKILLQFHERLFLPLLWTWIQCPLKFSRPVQTSGAEFLLTSMWKELLSGLVIFSNIEGTGLFV